MERRHCLAVNQRLAVARYWLLPACRNFRKTAPVPGPRISCKMPSHPLEGSKVRKPTALGKLPRPFAAGGRRRAADKPKEFIKLRRILY